MIDKKTKEMRFRKNLDEILQNQMSYKPTIGVKPRHKKNKKSDKENPSISFKLTPDKQL